MPEPRHQRITDRREPTERRYGHQPAGRLQRPVPLGPQDLREGEVATEGLSPGDEVDAGSRLHFGQTESSHIGQLPGDGFDRHRRPPHHEVRGRRAEPAVTVEDEGVCGGRVGHLSSLPCVDNGNDKGPHRSADPCA